MIGEIPGLADFRISKNNQFQIMIMHKNNWREPWGVHPRRETDESPRRDGPRGRCSKFEPAPPRGRSKDCESQKLPVPNHGQPEVAFDDVSVASPSASLWDGAVELLPVGGIGNQYKRNDLLLWHPNQQNKYSRAGSASSLSPASLKLLRAVHDHTCWRVDRA